MKHNTAGARPKDSAQICRASGFSGKDARFSKKGKSERNKGRTKKMARIRTIKPEFWTDEKTGNLSDCAKVVFLGLLNFADDVGVLELSISQLCARIYPYSCKKPFLKVSNALSNEILKSGLAVLFKNEDKTYLWIKNFTKHQRIDHPSKPIIDGFSEKMTIRNNQLDFDYLTNPHEDSRIRANTRALIGREGNGEGEGRDKTMSGHNNPDNDSDNSKVKKSYGELQNVFLTDTEFNKLQDKFGGHDNAMVKIEGLSVYIASIKNGANKYSSHYATILNWERRNATEQGLRHEPHIKMPKKEIKLNYETANR